MMKEFEVGTCKDGAPKGPSSAKDSAGGSSGGGGGQKSSTGVAPPQPQGFGYLLPLAFLACYLAYRAYNGI